MARIAVVAALALVALAGLPAAADADERTEDIVPGRYVVVFNLPVADLDAEIDGLEQRVGFDAALRYRRALTGFAAALTDAQAAALRQLGGLVTVLPDRRVAASAAVAAGEAVPTGVRRVEAASTTSARGPSTARVAVIDTGIDLDHPDLDVVAGPNCVTPGAPPDDDNGHGTHVAGTIAARNTGGGVVGVAPGTKVAAVKVLDAGGSGTMSQVLCGIDWVTGTRTDADPANDVRVANMSLGGTGAPVGSCSTTADAEHKAICASTNAGVTYVVAAGNSGWNFDYAYAPDVPAAYPQVLTVTAIGDSDGAPGATGGAPACRGGEADDRYASFSNYATTSTGRAHTTAAPGVCIVSDAPGGGLATMSGTSMASPHVAGLVALCLGESGGAGPCSGLTPAQIITKLRNDAQARTQAVTGYGFSGDPLRPVGSRYFGYLQWAGAGGTDAPPSGGTPTAKAPGSVTRLAGSFPTGTSSSLATDNGSYYALSSSAGQTSWYGTFTGVPAGATQLRTTYSGGNSRSCTQTVAFYRWSDGAWVTVDSRAVQAEAKLSDLAAPGAASAYVSATGQVRVRVACSGSVSWRTSADFLQLAYMAP